MQVFQQSRSVQGSTTGTTTFNPTDDSVYEGSETAIIAITGVSGGSATESGTQSKTITITDSLAAPTVTLSSSASSVAENESDLTLTATLNRQTFEDVTVTLTGNWHFYCWNRLCKSFNNHDQCG
jgi:hypothetical protein